MCTTDIAVPVVHTTCVAQQALQCLLCGGTPRPPPPICKFELQYNSLAHSQPHAADSDRPTAIMPTRCLRSCLSDKGHRSLANGSLFEADTVAGSLYSPATRPARSIRVRAGAGIPGNLVPGSQPTALPAAGGSQPSYNDSAVLFRCQQQL